jgi:hypothetical protein
MAPGFMSLILPFPLLLSPGKEEIDTDLPEKPWHNPQDLAIPGPAFGKY